MLYKYGTMHEVCKSASQFPEEGLLHYLAELKHSTGNTVKTVIIWKQVGIQSS